MDMTFEEFLSKATENGSTALHEGQALAMYAYVGGEHRPEADLTFETWSTATRVADVECGRALPLSEREQAKAEAAMLGLPFDESAELPPPERPDDEDSDDPAEAVAIAAVLADVMGEEFDQESALEQEMLDRIEQATAERERWTRASDRLHGWFKDWIATRG